MTGGARSHQEFYSAPIAAGLGLGASAITAGALSTIPIDYSAPTDYAVAPATENIGGLLAPEDAMVENPDIVSFTPWEEGGLDFLGTDLTQAEVESLLNPDLLEVPAAGEAVTAAAPAAASALEIAAGAFEAIGEAVATALFL